MPQTFVKSFRSVLLCLRPPLSVKLCRLDARLRSCFQRARRFLLITQLTLICTTFTRHEFNKNDELLDHVTTLWSWKVFWNVVKWEMISRRCHCQLYIRACDSELAMRAVPFFAGTGPWKRRCSWIRGKPAVKIFHYEHTLHTVMTVRTIVPNVRTYSFARKARVMDVSAKKRSESWTEKWEWWFIHHYFIIENNKNNKQ